MDYTVQFSDRKTYAITITDASEILIKTPYGTSKETIEQLLNKHKKWIQKHLEKKKNEQLKEPLTPEYIKELKQQAQAVLPVRTAAFAKTMGIAPTSVKITSAKKRFGSCSSKNAICYSFHLMEYPIEAIDYVIVHELAHIKHKNHGKEFYSLIEKYLPDYKERIKLLRN